MFRVGFFLFVFLAGCMPQGSGPSPRAVLVISSDEYSLSKIVETIDSIGSPLGTRIDKSQETIEIGESSQPRFSQFEIAYWYPSNGSEYYGVALVKWIPGFEDMSDRYFIDVYAADEACSLCGGVKLVLQNSGIKYLSACERPDISTEYEKFRCDI